MECWNLGILNLRTLKAENPSISESWSPGIKESQDLRSSECWNLRLSESRIPESQNLGI